MELVSAQELMVKNRKIVLGNVYIKDIKLKAFLLPLLSPVQTLLIDNDILSC